MNKKQDLNQHCTQQFQAEAEIQLADEVNSGQNSDVLSYELRVHQIELEMQNEELRRAHAALEASRDRYLQLYDFAPICYLTLTKDGMIAEANLTCASLLGVAREELVNTRFAEYIAPEESDHWHRHFLLAKQYRHIHYYELKLRRADGKYFHARLDCLCKQGDPESLALRIALTDITERKQAEEELRIAATAFETQEGIVVTDADRRILRMNQAFTRITGYTVDESVGRTPFFLRSGVHSEDFYREIWATIGRDGYWQGEIWDKRKNGDVFPVWLILSAVANEHGHITNYVGSFTDITAQKKAEKVLLSARKRLENQVATTQEELEKIKQESAEINSALNVLLRHRELDKFDAQSALSREMEGSVLPFLKKLKRGCSDRNQERLIDILKDNLMRLVKCYGRTAGLPAAYQHLTPTEVQVASMIRQGLPTKVIATTLNLAPGTVCIHRKHIRKKLGLESKATNLQNYLMSLDE